VTVTLWLDTDAEETIDLGATLPFYQAWTEIVRAGGDSFSKDYPDLAGVVSQCEDQEDADPDWLQDVRLQAANMLKEHGDSLSDRAQAILSLLSGDNPLSPEAATFAEEDPFDFGDISLGGLSREEIAEILIDAALDARDDAEFAAWDESKHPRGQPGNRGKFGPGGGAENPHESRDFAIDVHGELTERPNTPIFQHPVRKAIEDRIVHLLQAGKSRSKGEVSLTFRPVYGMTSVHQGDGIVATVYYFPADGKVLVSQPLVGGRKQARFDEHTPPAELEYKLRKVLGLKVPPEVERQYAHVNKAPRLANSDAKAAFDNAEFYDPNEARDEQGRWTTGGIGGVIADWHAHESGLSQEGATEEELQPLRQTLEKAQSAVEKKLTVYSELAGKLKEAEADVKQLEAAEPAEPQAKDYPPEPKEPELPEEPTPAQEKAYDRWDRDYTKWVDARAKVDEEHGRALERWERTIDRVRSRRDSLEERTDVAHEKLEDTIYAWQEKIDEKVAEAEGTLADRQAQSAEFYDPSQLRDHRGRWATGGGTGSTALPHAERQAQRESARETVRRFMAGKGSPSLQETSGLAQALSTLTVAQLHEVKKEHGLKASSPDKAGLVKKLAERFRAAREAKPVPSVQEVKPDWNIPAAYKGYIAHDAENIRKQTDISTLRILRETTAEMLERLETGVEAKSRGPGGGGPNSYKHEIGQEYARLWEIDKRIKELEQGHAEAGTASDLRREAVKSAIGDTYSRYNGTHQLLQDIAGKHDTLAGALAEAERQGLIDTRQRSPQTDVSPLQRDRQGEWVRRVLGQAYGEKEAPKAQPQPKPKPVRDRVPEGTYGPSKAALRFDSDKERQEIEEASRQIFGEQAKPQDLATLSGAPDGANVRLRVTTAPWAKAGHVSIEVAYHGYTNDGSYEGNRTIHYTPTGGARIENNLFRGKGSGLEMFGRQVEQATRFGVGHIETHAVGKFVAGPDPNKTYAEDNGYVTWPKFGYDGPLEQSDIDRLPANLRADVQTSGGNISGLMASKEGQAWWLRNGSAINLRFDLTPGSYSQRTLAAYLEKRGILK
jgi:hypothetical protein